MITKNEVIKYIADDLLDVMCLEQIMSNPMVYESFLDGFWSELDIEVNRYNFGQLKEDHIKFSDGVSYTSKKLIRMGLL